MAAELKFKYRKLDIEMWKTSFRIGSRMGAMSKTLHVGNFINREVIEQIIDVIWEQAEKDIRLGERNHSEIFSAHEDKFNHLVIK